MQKTFNIIFTKVSENLSLSESNHAGNIDFIYYLEVVHNSGDFVTNLVFSNVDSVCRHFIFIEKTKVKIDGGVF